MKRLCKWRLCNPSNLLDPIWRIGFVGRVLFYEVEEYRGATSITWRIFISAIFSMRLQPSSNLLIDFSFIIEAIVDTSILFFPYIFSISIRLVFNFGFDKKSGSCSRKEN